MFGLLKDTLQTPARTVYKALKTLAQIAVRFNADYRDMLRQVLDLRIICREAQDYSSLSPIEPSSHGGAKIAKAIARALSTHDDSIRACRVYV